MAKSILHKADSRGKADHGWLKSFHTFSFASYHNPDRVHFGALRVLNDDQVAGGQGFGEHPHNNMEIISIPLKGELKHRDDMGNAGVIRPREIQIMSAGTGIYHSEFNNIPDEAAEFLQIWVFPDKQNVEPRYDQVALNYKQRPNLLEQILSPTPEDDGVWIHQNAWFHIGIFEKGNSTEYSLKDPANNGVYIFVLTGSVQVGDQILNKRDGYGLWETETFTLEATADAEILLMEVPMELQ
ncbi:pirin family protein [Sphingobacterium haloxyli]|uniref:Pirin family protein n=1 Tax=Sphingobacterium haloxyli TaxID=2100533 RepID=A0A2S9J0J3_9SPHI|nr:pirin family protein [Sphingobacterium haloxyli]PRD46297.1 hypothetical protein C5745_16050 [Sphingobacterium haloxyli]